MRKLCNKLVNAACHSNSGACALLLPLNFQFENANILAFYKQRKTGEKLDQRPPMQSLIKSPTALVL
jgi:hypothetical protein